MEPSHADFSWDRLECDYVYSLCVNSVVHHLLKDTLDILALDLRTETISLIKTLDVVPHPHDGVLEDGPFIVKTNGCIGVVCHYHVVENKEMHIWILQD